MTTLSQLEVNNLKDNVLEYLRKNSNQATLFELITNCIIPDTVSVSVFKEYLREMEQDKVIKATEVSESRLLLRLTEKGKKFLIKGGYSNSEKELSKKEQQEVLKKERQELSKKEPQKEEYPQSNRERTNLKIENLKLTKWLSIIAIIISVVSIFISIFKK
jgi:hypothetical protein